MLSIVRCSPLLLILVLAGCGSAETLPPPAAPPSATSGARLDTRARTLTVGTETVDAGAGPAHVAETAEHVYVTDTVQGALLVFRKEPELVLQRRSHLPGEPYELTVDGARERLYVTLRTTGEVVGLTLDGAVKEVSRVAAPAGG